jgi:hypothetical protein
MISELRIKEIWVTQEIDLSRLKSQFEGSGVVMRFVGDSANYEWTAPCLVHSMVVYKVLKDRSDISTVFFLSFGAEMFYPLSAKRMGFNFSGIQFCLVNVADGTLKAMAVLEQFPSTVNDILINDAENYIVNNACKSIEFRTEFEPVNIEIERVIAYVGCSIEAHSFRLFSKAIVEAIQRGAVLEKLELWFVDLPTQENIWSHHLVDVCKAKGVDIAVSDALNHCKSSCDRSVDVVYMGRRSYLGFATSRLPARRYRAIDSFPLDQNQKGLGTVERLVREMLGMQGKTTLVPRMVEVAGKSYAFSPECSGDPLVSACVTHFDRPRNLVVALDSLVAQTYENVEIVVSDDGSSSPEARQLIESLRSDGWRGREIEVVTGENAYLGAARNRALKVAKGRYVFFMDDDNIAKPEEVEVLVDIAKKNDADFVGSFMLVFHSAEPDPDLCDIDSVWGGVGSVYSGGALQNHYSDANGLYKRSTLNELEGFTEDYGIGYEDWELFLRLAKNHAKVLVVPEALYYYRVDPQQSMVKSVSEKTSVLRVLRHAETPQELAFNLFMAGSIRKT